MCASMIYTDDSAHTCDPHGWLEAHRKMKNLTSMRRLKKWILLELTKKEEDITDGAHAKLFGENSGKFIFGLSK